MSQSDLSKLTGLSGGAIQGYECDCIHPSREAIFKLGQIFDLDYICSNGYSKFLISNYPEKLKIWIKKENISIRKAAKILGIGKTT